jgi:hypothetical protein
MLLTGLGLYGHWQPVCAWAAMGLSLLLLPASWWVAQSLFQMRVEELELLRRGEAVWSGVSATVKQKGK